MPPVKGQMFKYSENDMEKAIEEVLRGQQVSTTAKKYGIPRVTLLYKSKGKTPRQRKMGPQPYLKQEQEKILVKWIIEVARAGFPVQHHQLIRSVQMLMKELKQDNPFKDDKPGRTWLTGFLKRNPEVSTRVAQNITSTRSAVKKEAIQKWFQEVYYYLQENNCEEVLKEPSRVYNADETAFFLNPKGNRVLAKKGDKTVYQQINPDEKECLTVLVTGNAAGQLVSPMVIFKYERIPKELALSVPEQWGIGKSESGWMTGETFYEFITNIFDKWLTEKQIPRPVILFIDGHSSHLTLHTSRFCADNKIILVALYPNATHLIQPMDVSVFRSLKGGWRDAVHQWRIDNNSSPILRKLHFCPLLKKVLEEKCIPLVLKNGFRKCGLFPWNANAVTFPNEKTDFSKKELELQELKNGKYFIEKYIEKDKLSLFKTSGEWTDDIEDLSFFNFYKNVCVKCETLETELKNLKSKKNKGDTEEQPDHITINVSDISINNYSVNEPVEDFNYEDLDESHMHQSCTNKETDESTKTSEKNISEIFGEAALDSGLKATILKHITTPIKNSSKEEQIIMGTIHEPVTNTDFERASVGTKPSSSSLDEVIPSPFKKMLFWPGPKLSAVKKRKMEKVPAVASSKDWQSYHENKENKKIKIMEEKKKRAEERQKKKEANNILKQQNRTKRQKVIRKNRKPLSKKNDYSSSSDDESWVESGNSLDDVSSEEFGLESDIENMDTYKQGDYILVKFPGKKREHKYACIIQKIFKNCEAQVVAMNYCDDNKTLFKTNDIDVSVIKYDQVLKKLPQPKIIVSGERLKYHFPDSLETDG